MNEVKSTRMILHKESCITCKRIVNEIQKIKNDIEKRDFFKEPLTEKELRKIIKMTGKSPIELIRKRDKMYKELEFETKNYSDKQVIEFMLKYPGLIIRPIIITKNKVYVGKESLKNMQD